MAVVAGLRMPRLRQAELVTQMALLALPNRFVGRGSPDIVAALAGETGNRRTFQRGDGISGFIGRKLPFGNSFIHGEQVLRKPLRTEDGDIGGKSVTTGVVLYDLGAVTLGARTR